MGVLFFPRASALGKTRPGPEPLARASGAARLGVIAAALLAAFAAFGEASVSAQGPPPRSGGGRGRMEAWQAPAISF
jgi:hypothetical protein